MTAPEYRSTEHSRTTITELMIPSYANFGGRVHGGILLNLMDKVAYACSSKHAGSYCVTVAVDGVNFRAPVDVGELVSMHASVNYVGNTSLLVGIRVESENVLPARSVIPIPPTSPWWPRERTARPEKYPV